MRGFLERFTFRRARHDRGRWNRSVQQHLGIEIETLEARVMLSGNGVVADYADDFQSTPAAGWQYLWNSGGAFGDSNNYSDLTWQTWRYRATAEPYLNLSNTGGHPGSGADNPPSGGIDRFAIAAYTVTADGNYTIGDSSVARDGEFGDGVEVAVHIDSNAVTQLAQIAPEGSGDFDASLGFLSAGDTIYVGLGPDGPGAGSGDSNDAFSWDFSIVHLGNSTDTTAVQTGNWNDASTWSDGVPDDTLRAIVPQGVTVTLAGIDHVAEELVVHGVLDVAEQAGTTKTLTTDWIHVNSGGVFQIGTETDRYDANDFVVTLTGTDPNADHVIETAAGTMQVNGNNSFLMAEMGGRLQFFGEEKLSFTKLGVTAEAGATQITVENIIERNFDGTTSAASDGALNWQVGDQIVISSSSRDYADEEVRSITAVTNQGTQTLLTLDQSLANRHYGEIETYGSNIDSSSTHDPNRTWDIDLRAEVALLSRNVRITGLASQDTDVAFGDRALAEYTSYGVDVNQSGTIETGEVDVTNGVGANTMIMGTAGQITVDGVQFDRGGQSGRLGRYPMHWHVAGDRTGDVLRNTSITNSNNRGVTIHGTQNLNIEGVVLHDVHGHGFFFEDGVETGNELTANIAFGIHKVGGLYRADGSPPVGPPYGQDNIDPFQVDVHDRGKETLNTLHRFESSAAFWITNPDNIWVGNIAAGADGSGFWFVLPTVPIGVAANDPQYAGINPIETPIDRFSYNSAHATGVGLVIDRGIDIDPTSSPSENGSFYNPSSTSKIDNFTGYKNRSGTYFLFRGPAADNFSFDEMRFADNEQAHFYQTKVPTRNSLYVGHSQGNADLSERVGGHVIYDGPSHLLDSHFAGFAEENAHVFVAERGALNQTHHVVSGLSFEGDGSYGHVSILNDGINGSNFTQLGIAGVIYDQDGSLTAGVGGGAGSTLVTVLPFDYDSEDFKPVGWNAWVSDDEYAQFRIDRDKNDPTGQDPLYIVSPDGDRELSRHPFSAFGAQPAVKVGGGEYSLEFPADFDPAVDKIDLTYNIKFGPIGAGWTMFVLKDIGSFATLENANPNLILVQFATLAELQSANTDGYFHAPNGDIYLKAGRPGVTSYFNRIYTIIENPNLAPVASDDSALTNEETPVSISVLANDNDAESDPLFVVFASDPANGNAVINGDNSITYTPNGNFSGSDSFAYQVSDGNGGTDTATVNVDIANVNDAPIGTVTISGTATEDEILTVSNTLADDDGLGTITYQWQRNGANISGAVSNTYTLGDADVGTTINVVASYTDGQGTSESVSSSGVGPVANINDSPLGLPTISGTATENQTLVSDASGISDADGLGVFSHQWLHDGILISGANANSYTLTGDDVGSRISVSVSYLDGHGTIEGPLTSSETAIVDPVPSSGPKLAAGVLLDVGTAGWTTVSLPQSYTSMVVVATPVYGSGQVPLVTRISNLTANSFDVKVQRADGIAVDLSGVQVQYIVVEEGVYTQAADGISMEAVRFTSTITDENNSWIGQQRGYLGTYTSPVVLGQVMSSNDANWSTFWSRGLSRSNVPDSTNLYMGKHVGEDGNTVRSNETIGYLVIEAGSGEVDDLKFSAGVGSDIVRGVGNGGTYSYNVSGLNLISSAVASMTGVDGADGGWALLNGPLTSNSTSLSVIIDEDQLGNSERSHTTEQVAYFAFEQALPPIAADDTASTQVNTPVVIDVLSNDSDPNGDLLFVDSVADGANGSVSINADGTVSYLPDTDFIGSDTFTYTAADGNGGTSTATVDVEVIGNPGVSNDDLVTHLTLDGNAADTSPHGGDNNGSIQGGASFVTDGQRGQVLSLDGADDLITIGNTNDINTATVTERTVSLAFNAVDVNRRQVLYEEGGGTRGLVIYIDAGKLYVGGWNKTASQSGWNGTWLSTDITSGQWHHVTLTLNGGASVQAGALRGYLDGQLFGSGEGSQVWTHGGGIGVGSNNGSTVYHDGTSGANNRFAGLLDDFRIYNRTLSDEEVTIIANP